MKDLLVAGQRGDWTFVYDIAGVTGWACALAGLTWTTGEFRAQPLLVGEVTSSYFYEVMAKMRSKMP